jgi:DNA-binding beta-propeller fold protein YncE
VAGIDLRPAETVALEAQALIEEARRRHRRRQKRMAVSLIVVAVLVGIAVASVLALSSGPARRTTAPPGARPFLSTAPHGRAYVTTSGGIVEIDLARGTVLRRIVPHGSALALNPIAIAPGGRTAYALSDNVLTPINLRTGSTGAPITIGPSTGGEADASGFPGSLALSPNGDTALIPMPAQGTLIAVDLGQPSAAVSVHLGGRPEAVAVTPDGATAFVSNPGLHEVDVVNLATDTEESPLRGVADPGAIVITRSGERAYVANGNVVTPVDLATRVLRAPITLSAPGSPFTLAGPMAVSQDDRDVYVADVESVRGDGRVAVIATGSDAVVARLGGFTDPAGLGLVGGSGDLYVLNVAWSSGAAAPGGLAPHAVTTDALVPLSRATGRVGKAIPIPASPRSFGLAASGSGR